MNRKWQGRCVPLVNTHMWRAAGVVAFLISGWAMAAGEAKGSGPGQGALPSPRQKPVTIAGGADWTNRWFLDGDLAKVQGTPRGLVLASGPNASDDSHCVLWTRESFAGDLRVSWDFTRLDTNTGHVSVCIVYLQATGIGDAAHGTDILTWARDRAVPAMSTYFKFMNGYHFSYACTGGKDFNYVRARRYPMKDGSTFDGSTRILPSYDNVDLFHPGDTWHLAIEKRGTALVFSADRGGDSHVWKWDASSYAPITEGRIGLRQMNRRESRYENVTVTPL